MTGLAGSGPASHGAPGHARGDTIDSNLESIVSNLESIVSIIVVESKD